MTTGPALRPPRLHAYAVRVFYGDTDQMGVAYYANYLRWFEMARNEYLRAVGYTYRRLETEGIVLPVIEASCRYFRPARYDDALSLEAWIEARERVRVRFGYRILRAGESEALAAGHTVHASLGPDSVPRRLPAALVEALERFEASGPFQS